MSKVTETIDMVTEIIKPEVVKTETESLIKQARAVIISDNKTYSMAMEMLPKIKVARKVVQDVFGTVADKAFVAYKAAKNVFNQFDEPLAEIEKKIKKDGGDWQYKQQQIADAERRKLEEAARKEEEAKQKALAASLKKSGQKEMAKAVLAQPIVVAPVEVKSEPPKVEGVSFSTKWSAECFDIVALCKAVTLDNSLTNMVMPNMPALNKLAEGMQANMKIPGCKAVSRQIVSARKN